MINLQKASDFRNWNRWNKGSNRRKLKIYWSIKGPIKQIKNQEPNYKKHSNLGLAIEFDMDEIAWN